MTATAADSDPAKGEAPAGTGAAGAERPSAASGLGMQTLLPLFTAGATIAATGAGVRDDAPGLGMGLMLLGTGVLAAPATSLWRDWWRRRTGKGVSPPARSTGRTLAPAVAGSLLVGTLIGFLLVTVWGGEGGGAAPASQQPAQAACATAASAEAVIADFKARGLPIGETEVSAGAEAGSASDDPTIPASKATFRDTRLPALGPRRALTVPDGGEVAVFSTVDAAAAQKRAVEQAPRPAAALAEYAYHQGPVLLLVSGRLAPGDAAAYEAALRAIVPCNSGA